MVQGEGVLDALEALHELEVAIRLALRALGGVELKFKWEGN